MMNIALYAATALIPLVIGFIWYNPKVFGNAWMRTAGMTEEKMQGANMALIFGLTYVFSFFLAFGLSSIVIHQNHIYSALMNEPGFFEEGSEIKAYIADFMARYGQNFRTFKHGVLHGVIGAIVFALPTLGVNALFERKGFAYIAINVGYWVVSFGLMGGIISAFA